jgi:hypothetical protein
LVGTWTRTLTAAGVKAAHIAPGEADHAKPGQLPTLIVQASGAAEVKPKGATGPIRWKGRIVPLGADQIRITIPIDVPNAYRWHLAGRVLTLTKIKDNDRFNFRAAWFAGTWRRK